jgi:uracil-DNA glycosylase family 4
MKGFFNAEQVKSQSRPDGKTYSCVSCGLYKFADTPRMRPSGRFQKGILNIGGGINSLEDHSGKHWKGKAGRILKRTYAKFGIDLNKDCLNTTAVHCYSKNKPKPYEIQCCRKHVFKVINRYKPHVIMLFGDQALQSVIGSQWKKDLGNIDKWRGFCIPDRDLNAWICPVFHPSYVEKQSDFPEVRKVWEMDIENALAHVNIPFPDFPDEKSQIEYVTDPNEVQVLFEKLQLGYYPVTCLDYETTGLKPHARLHKIVCCAVAVSENRVFSFMMPKKKKDRFLFCRYLQSENSMKMAANMKFEEAWSRVRLGTGIKPWIWDTLIAAHIIDNRTNILSLKFQSYVHFGIADYDSEVSPYLKGTDPKNANSMNRIYEFIERYSERDLLTYCGMDALLEYKLAMLQMKQIGYKLPKLEDWTCGQQP